MISPPSTMVPPLSASTVVSISRRLVMMSAASGTLALLIEETSWLTLSWIASPWLTCGTTRRMMPMSWRSMVSKGLSALPPVAKVPVRNGTFWPTRIEASWLSSVVRLGVDSRFALVDCAERLDEHAELVLARDADGQPGRRDRAAPTGTRRSRRMFASAGPLFGNEVAANRRRGRGVAEAELHAELLGDVAGDLDDRRLDQHLRAALVELGDQRAEVVLHLGARTDHHRVDLVAPAGW